MGLEDVKREDAPRRYLGRTRGGIPVYGALFLSAPSYAKMLEILILTWNFPYSNNKIMLKIKTSYFKLKVSLDKIHLLVDNRFFIHAPRTEES